jgi:flavin-binding protein dodecin
MSVHKTIEVMAESPKGWHEAAQAAVSEAGKTVKGIKSVWVKDMSAEVGGDGQITVYRVNCKITFEVK